MPYGSPIVLFEMIDYDEGDQSEGRTSLEDMMRYLSENVMSFSFSDHDRKKDKMEVTFRNDDYQLMAKSVFVKGQKFDITWGRHGETSAPRRMVITQARGSVDLIITLLDVVHILDKKRKSRHMNGATHSEFVRKIAEEHGYKNNFLHVDETTVRRNITQPRDMTDAKKLRLLARRNGFQFYIDAMGFHWHKRVTDRTPVRVFQYRTDMNRGTILEPPEFDANITKGIAKIRVLAIDPIRKTVIDETAGISDETDVSLGSQDELYDPDTESPGNRGARISEEEVVSGGLATAEEAKSEADARYRETAKKRYKMTLKIIGDAKFSAKNLIAIFGINEMLDGIYYIKEKIDTISSGSFESTLECEKDALGAVNATKKRKRRSNVNPSVIRLEDTEILGEIPEFKRMITAVRLPNGEYAPGWIFTDDSGATGQTSRMTEDEVSQLTQKQLKALSMTGVTGTYPDP